MNRFKIILFLLAFNVPLKAWTAGDSEKNLPLAVMDAMLDIVFVSSEHGIGSGFIIRDDDESRAILVTAYHVIKESANKLDHIKVEDIHRNELKIREYCLILK